MNGHYSSQVLKSRRRLSNWLCAVENESRILINDSRSIQRGEIRNEAEPGR
jgi:hypothetical protein